MGPWKILFCLLKEPAEDEKYDSILGKDARQEVPSAQLKHTHDTTVDGTLFPRNTDSHYIDFCFSQSKPTKGTSMSSQGLSYATTRKETVLPASISHSVVAVLDQLARNSGSAMGKVSSESMGIKIQSSKSMWIIYFQN